MFQNSWSIKISEPPLHASVAWLPEPSLVYQGKSNQLSVFTNNQTINLPIRKEIIDLACILDEQVLVLTRYSLICFDFLRNEERFTKEFESAQKLFVIEDRIYVASGTSLYCFDTNGQEEYVNHVSSPVIALTNVIDSSGLRSSTDIVIATNDFTMLRYSKLNIVFDYGKIIGRPTSLCWIGKGVLVGTEEGLVAFYESKKYKWKAKSVHSVLKIIRFNEISKYSQNEEFHNQKPDKILVIRKDGNIQSRDWESGGTLAKVKCGETIINCFSVDFRKEGANQLLCMLESGTVKAFNLKDQISDNPSKATAAEVLQKGDEIEELNKKKQELLLQISQLTAKLEKGESDGSNEPILRPDFKLMAILDYKEGLVLELRCENGYMTGLTFEQGIMPLFTDKVPNITYKFLGQTSNWGEVTCQLLIHSSASTTKYQVKKIQIFLPKFWKWGLDPTVRNQINGKLTFKMIERNQRFLIWIKECFFMNLSEKDQERLESSNEMKLRFYNWYEKKQIEIIFNQTNGTVTIYSSCLKTMGQIFQDLVNFTGLKHLNSQLQFPQQKQKVKNLLETVQKLSQTKTNITTDLADSINTIKFLLVKGESARVVGEMKGFRKTYAQIMEQNRNLISEIEKKNANTKILTETLKSVNGFINQIANVRYGEAKDQVIARCREAIKKKKFPQIFHIMDKGSETI